jgi:hypothetical protein
VVLRPVVGAPPPYNKKPQYQHARNRARDAAGQTQDDGERQRGTATRVRGRVRAIALIRTMMGLSMPI